MQTQEEIDAALQRSIGRMAALEKGMSGRVVLGVVSTAKYYAPRIVAQLAKAVPDIELVLKVGNRRTTISELERGAYDLCIMGRPPRGFQPNAIPMADHPHVIIAAPDHPLVGQKGLTADDIVRERFILREPGSGTRVLATRFLSTSRTLGDSSTIEMDSNETIKQAVMNGLGIALLSAHTISDDFQSGRLAVLNVSGTPIARVWYLITPNAGHDFSGATNVVAKWILENVEQYLPNIDLTWCRP